MSHYYCGYFAGVELVFNFRYEKTKEYFGNWLIPVSENQKNPIRVPKYDIQEWITKWGREDDPYTEFGLSAFRASDHLLLFDKCVFHAASIIWKGKAFLFTAPSGVGKTTQLRNWQQLYPDETEIINGDKPIISIEREEVWVYSSPWKGKERIGNDSLSAQLGGIIILEQGIENIIKRLNPSQSVSQILRRFLCTVESEDIIRLMCGIEERIISSIPIWKMNNTGDLNSTKMLHDFLQEELCL